MPIYAYACNDCGFTKDVLQKMSDPKLTQCLQCGKDTFEKQVTAAGFQLKGGGWYETDFKNGGSGSGSTKSKSAEQASEKADAKKADASKETKKETKNGSADKVASKADSLASGTSTNANTTTNAGAA